MRARLILLLALVCVPAVSHAQDRYALLVQGVSGEESYATQHRGWLDGMTKVLREKLGFDAAHLTVLSEVPAGTEKLANAANVTDVLGGLAKKLKADDLLFVMLIGHGSGQGPEAKFNLMGPDLSVAEWKALVAAVPGRLVFIDATSSSFAFLGGLAGPGRVVITATNRYSQIYHTVFPEGFIKAFSTPAADADHDGRISIWEAFAFASREVTMYYEQTGHLATETAVLDDSGKGTGREATAPSQPGTLASVTFLDAAARATSTDPALQSLYDRRKTLSDQIDELRRKRQSMKPEEFDQAFETLIVDLSLVSREIRRKGGQ